MLGCFSEEKVSALLNRAYKRLYNSNKIYEIAKVKELVYTSYSSILACTTQKQGITKIKFIE